MALFWEGDFCGIRRGDIPCRNDKVGNKIKVAKALVAWWGKICEWLRVPGPPDGVGRSHFRLRVLVGSVGLNQEAEMNFSFKNDTLAAGGGKRNQAAVEVRSYLQ